MDDLNFITIAYSHFGIVIYFINITDGSTFHIYISLILKLFAFMCCPFIVSLMIGVSNKAYSDTCGCLLNEFQVTLLSKQPQEHICNHRELSYWDVVGPNIVSKHKMSIQICH